MLVLPFHLIFDTESISDEHKVADVGDYVAIHAQAGASVPKATLTWRGYVPTRPEIRFEFLPIHIPVTRNRTWASSSDTFSLSQNSF